MDDRCDQHSAHDRAIRSHDRRLDAHGEQIDKINETLSALKEIERQNQQRIDAMDERLVALEARPARRWEDMADRALWALVAAAVGWALAGIGAA
ncbi:hypothetical protein B5F40_01815 [Gordonibacter sp. An230]|uniref:hypothetical protein n=1 Tax=Gordonibacter sp. An230 TaxID=1965592 RepID=UPI000B37046F|nr:hypothetical protein [Gordonibacter sp. An230]OUO92096.1 hypothetical protein B5F40_01815 [Gordonibacter sp. An230]